MELPIAFRQLTSFKELHEEGKALKHCVRTYAWKCIKHGTSIWSLQQQKNERIKRLVTIEVTKDKAIVQARKKLNSNPTAFHWDLIRQWAEREELTGRWWEAVESCESTVESQESGVENQESEESRLRLRVNAFRLSTRDFSSTLNHA